MAIITTAVTGAIAAGVANFFQQRQFKFKEKETRQTELREQREAFVNDLMERVSSRLFDLLQVIKIMTDEIDDETDMESRIIAYKKSVRDTAINYSRDIAYLESFFSEEAGALYALEVTEGPGGFVDIDRAWRLVFHKYYQTQSESFPQIQKLLDDGKITEEKFEEMNAALNGFMEILLKKAKELKQKARNLGYNLIGTDFYPIITSKEDLNIEMD